METPEDRLCRENPFGLEHCFHRPNQGPRQTDIKGDHWRSEKQCCWCGKAVREVHGLKLSTAADATRVT